MDYTRVAIGAIIPYNYAVDARPTCSVLVCSCDKYADLHAPFSALWRKFWPDCPFETVLLTETAAPEEGSCFDRVIFAGKGLDWCEMLVFALERISTPYVMLLMDDYLLNGRVDTTLVLSRLETARALGADNLRLIPSPEPRKANTMGDGPWSAAGLARYKPLTAYCIATQTGFWRKDFLRAVARGKHSAWQFERYGSFDAAVRDAKLFAAVKREFPFVDAVHKGYWERAGAAACRANGIEPDFSRRTFAPPVRRAIEALKTAIFAVFPASAIVKIQNRFNLGAKKT